MAELAAFSLAVNILQIVDFGARFVGLAWKIWRSNDIDSLEIAKVQLIAEDFKATIRQLQTETASDSQLIEDATNSKIFLLVRNCENLSQQIINSVKSIEIPDKNHRKRTSKRKAFVAAFKIIWKGDDIKALETQLNSYRSEIVLQLAVSLRSVLSHYSILTAANPTRPDIA